MKQAGKQILILLLICVGVFMPAVNVYGEEAQSALQVGNLYALSAVLMDGQSGRVLYEKNGSQKRAMASTTKIMTCILVLENGNLTDKAITSSYAASMPKVHLGAVQGEAFYVKDLLYSLMLESHNDSAVILAEHVAGTVPEFVEKMNEKARELGCLDTWFITPNGLDAEETVNGEKKIHETTAADLARIMRYCILESPQKEMFLEITGTSSYHFTDAEGKRSFSCVNHNAFLTMMEGASSGKTGFTSKAGYCYVGALRKDGKTLIVALLGCGWPNHKGYKWSDTRKLMEYGLEYYSLHTLSEAALPEYPSAVPVLGGQSRVLGMTAKVGLQRIAGEEMQILLRNDEKVQVDYEGSTQLTAPVHKGDKVGKLIYHTNGRVWKTEDIVAAESVEKIDYVWCLRETMERLAAGKEP